MSKPKILIHVRDYFWDIYQNMLHGVDRYDLAMLPDFPRPETTAALHREFQRLMAEPALPSTGFNEDDIIRRCRLLRNLPRERATRTVRAMYAALLPHVEAHDWVAIMGQSVDDYTTHLLSLFAERKGIPYIGFCSSYFPGYTQITVGWDGACATGRNPSLEESEAALARVSGNRFRQDYANMAVYSLPVHVKRVGRYWVKRAYFGWLRHLRGAPDHIHYIFQPYLAQQKRLSDFVGLGAFHQDWEKRIAAATRPSVYIPLGYTPECSTDYMIADDRYIDYEETIVRIATALGRMLTVVIKDHFHMLGIRRPAFYRQLRAIEGVVLVPPQVNSNALLHAGLDRVLSGGGSVGIEATIRGKHVFSFSDTIYWMPRGDCRHLRLEELAQWPEQILGFRSCPPDPVEFVRRCLNCTLPFDFMIVEPHDGRKGRQLQAFVDTFLGTPAAAARGTYGHG